MTQPVGFIGLGNMGRPMAQRLLDAGHPVRVHTRSMDKAAPLLEAGAERADTPAEVVAGPDALVISMLPDDGAAEAVSDALLSRLGAGGVHVSMSTISPDMARHLARVHGDLGAHCLAGPVFGRPDAAAAGRLWVCLAGDDGAKARARPVLEAFSQGFYDYGATPETANVVKLTGNFLLASALEAMAEAFTFAEKHGVDRTAVAQQFGETLFACPVYRNYGRAIAEQAYSPAGFRLDLGHKDVNLVLDAAGKAGVPMPFASHLQDRLLALMAAGKGGVDWAGIGLGVSRDAGDSIDDA